MAVTLKDIQIELGHTCKNHFVILDCRGMTPATDENLSEFAKNEKS